MASKEQTPYINSHLFHQGFPQTVEKIIFTDDTDSRLSECQESSINIRDISAGRSEKKTYLSVTPDGKTAIVHNKSGTFALTENGGTRLFSTHYSYAGSFPPLTSIEGLERIDTSKTTSMASMFDGQDRLTSLDLSMWDTGSVTNMNGMFSDCKSLKKIDIYRFKTSNVRDFRCMFFNCKALKRISLGGFDMRSATDLTSMFYGCRSLTEANISDWRFERPVSLDLLFYGCKSLQSTDSFKWLETTCAESMNAMFLGCSSLKEADLPGFDTSGAKDMREMFAECENIERVSMPCASTAKTPKIQGIFRACPNLKKVELPRHPMAARSLKKEAKRVIGCNTIGQRDEKSVDTSKSI